MTAGAGRRRGRKPGPVRPLWPGPEGRPWHLPRHSAGLGGDDPPEPPRGGRRDRPTMGVMTEQAETIRTAIITVDDDPGVSRAVARDLRRRYEERYRIVRAESGADALEALRQMKLRGDLVAAILADYRMPGMNGIEFLERAMDIYPGARRGLPTAHARPRGAAGAGHGGALHHHPLQPADP